jgi:uncharacterized protein (TIGR03437 family)
LICPLAAEQIVAGFGTGLSVKNVPATKVPLPTELDGTTIGVRDATGMERPAGLFFVAPTQVNYLIPAGTATGPATITLRRNGVDTAQGTATIETVAPGVFTANANGQGAPAAVLFRRSGGVDTFETVVQFNSTNSTFEPRGLDLGPETDLVILLLFGTGFRAQTSATATIGGEAAPVEFAGAVMGLEGLEQANVRIPRSLVGRGVVDVVFTVNSDKPANTVQIKLK